MGVIIPVVLGFAGAMIANKVGVNSSSLDWWLICCPWWLLAAAINYIVYS